jgi:hypothetical protein
MVSVAVLPGGRHHSHFPQMWQFKKINGRGKFIAMSGRVGPKKSQMWPYKILLKVPSQTDRKHDKSIANCSSLRPFSINVALKKN